MTSAFKLPDLPYDYTVLEPYIDSQTMNIHHKMHHNAYVTKLNDALKDKPQQDIIEVCKSASKATTAVRNNGGGHYNHSLFWTWMCKVGASNVGPTGELKAKIDETFGSLDEMKKRFNDAAATRFGSGWVRKKLNGNRRHG
jgi:Fe-Mn family superoxide dismutase